MKILKKLAVLSAVALIGQVEAAGRQAAQEVRNAVGNFTKNRARALARGLENHSSRAGLSDVNQAAFNSLEGTLTARAAAEAEAAAAQERSVAGRLLRAKEQAEGYLQGLKGRATGMLDNQISQDAQSRLGLAGSMAAGGAGLAAVGGLAAGGAALATKVANVNSADQDGQSSQDTGVQPSQARSGHVLQMERYNPNAEGWEDRLKTMNEESRGSAPITPLSNEQIAAMRAEGKAFKNALESTYGDYQTAEAVAAQQAIEDLVGLQFAKKELVDAGLNLEAAKNSGASLSTLRDLQDDVRAAAINVLGQEQALQNDAFDYENAQKLINSRNARTTAAKDYANAVGYKAKYGFDRAKDWTSAMSNNAYDAATQRFGRAKSWTMSAPRNVSDFTRQGLSNGTSWLSNKLNNGWLQLRSLFRKPTLDITR
jgi:hypothetical protein